MLYEVNWLSKTITALKGKIRRRPEINSNRNPRSLLAGAVYHDALLLSYIEPIISKRSGFLSSIFEAGADGSID
ncbi:MAG: hypothetical protein K0R34_4321 [Herbinix sp.]|nr:hypothetical protein [Herbinix sp.]